MTKPETKTVLGRVFTRADGLGERWECDTKTGWLTLDRHEYDGFMIATLHDDDSHEVACAIGPTESDAILALQSTLRKMALLEVVE
jgi:hypothetical protein